MRWVAFLICLGLIAQPPPLSAPGGLSVMVDGRPIGTFASVAFKSGNGMTWSNTVTGSTVTIAADFNTAMLPTKDVLQSGACTFLHPLNGTTAYTYSLGPACHVLTAYTPGQRFWLQTEFPCPAIASQSGCSLNIDSLGIRSIKQADGTSDPLFEQFDFKKGVPIRYDGTVFRIEWQH